MGKIKVQLIDTPLEDRTPEYVYSQAQLMDTVKILRREGQNELADMIKKYVDDTEDRLEQLNECV